MELNQYERFYCVILWTKNKERSKEFEKWISMKIINSFDIRIAIFQKAKWIYLQVIHSSPSWCWNIFPHFEFQIKEKWERYPSNNNKKSKWKNQFKIRLTGLKERVQKMNELEEWETIYKEIVCNRITYFHFSHSLRFLFILAL